MIETISEPNFDPSAQRRAEESLLRKGQRKLLEKLKVFLLEKYILIYLIGFLLGRAIILSVISPFPIAFLATIWFIHRKRTVHTALVILAGALTVSPGHATYVL